LRAKAGEASSAIPLRTAGHDHVAADGLDYMGRRVAYGALLTAQGIQHSTETPTAMAHTWESGWVPIALAALRADSVNLH